MNTTTHTIDGHRITLEPGHRYFASRPMAERGRKTYPVRIRAISERGLDLHAEPDAMVDGLTYDEANEFLAAFNNGATSFEGRVWE